MFRSLLFAVLSISLLACDSDEEGGECAEQQLASRLNLQPTAALHSKCTRKSTTDCVGKYADNCKEGECFNDLCQVGNCTIDADCANLGEGALCELYVLDGTDFGKRCKIDRATRSTTECDDSCLSTCSLNDPDSCIKLCCR